MTMKRYRIRVCIWPDMLSGTLEYKDIFSIDTEEEPEELDRQVKITLFKVGRQFPNATLSTWMVENPATGEIIPNH